mgnify:CR=1 FL=1
MFRKEAGRIATTRQGKTPPIKMKREENDISVELRPSTAMADSGHLAQTVIGEVREPTEKLLE